MIEPAADLFDVEFWPNAVRKVKKTQARKAFMRAVKKAGVRTVLDGWKAWNSYWRSNPAEFNPDPEVPWKWVPHPSTWLANDGWTEPPPGRAVVEELSPAVLYERRMARYGA